MGGLAVVDQLVGDVTGVVDRDGEADADVADWVPVELPPAVEAMAVLMPTTSPLELIRAPPELPGLMAASVWMASTTAVGLEDCCELPKGSCDCSPPRVIARFTALTMPALTDPSRPSGLPMARTVSPTCRSALLPSVAGVRPVTSCALMTARSLAGSRPTTSASARLPSENVTVIEPPFSLSAATWLLVRMRPSLLSTMPEPWPSPPSTSMVIETTLGSTAAATCDSGSEGSLPEDAESTAALRLLTAGVAGVVVDRQGDQRPGGATAEHEEHGGQARHGPPSAARGRTTADGALGERRHRGRPGGGGRAGRGVRRGCGRAGG